MIYKTSLIIIISVFLLEGIIPKRTIYGFEENSYNLRPLSSAIGMSEKLAARSSSPGDVKNGDKHSQVRKAHFSKGHSVILDKVCSLLENHHNLSQDKRKERYQDVLAQISKLYPNIEIPNWVSNIFDKDAVESERIFVFLYWVNKNIFIPAGKLMYIMVKEYPQMLPHVFNIKYETTVEKESTPLNIFVVEKVKGEGEIGGFALFDLVAVDGAYVNLAAKYHKSRKDVFGTILYEELRHALDRLAGLKILGMPIDEFIQSYSRGIDFKVIKALLKKDTFLDDIIAKAKDDEERYRWTAVLKELSAKFAPVLFARDVRNVFARSVMQTLQGKEDASGHFSAGHFFMRHILAALLHEANPDLTDEFIQKRIDLHNNEQIYAAIWSQFAKMNNMQLRLFLKNKVLPYIFIHDIDEEPLPQITEDGSIRERAILEETEDGRFIGFSAMTKVDIEEEAEAAPERPEEEVSKPVEVDDKLIENFKRRIEANFDVNPNFSISLNMLLLKYNEDRLPDNIVIACLRELGFEESEGKWTRKKSRGVSTKEEAPEADDMQETKNLLEVKIKDIIRSFGWGEHVAGDFHSMVFGWLDEKDIPYMISWHRRLMRARKKLSGKKDELAKVEAEILKDIGDTIKKYIRCTDDVDDFELTEIVHGKHVCCTGAAMLTYIIGTAIGFSVEGMWVKELWDNKTMGFEPETHNEIGHVASMITVSNGKKVMMDIGYDFIATEPFKTEEQCDPVGNFWKFKHKKNPLKIHRVFQLLNRDAFHVAILNKKGIYLSDMGRHEEALKIFEHAMTIFQDYACAHYGHGVVYSRLGKYDIAIKHYDRALELDPEYAAAYNNRGNAYLHLRKSEKALGDFLNAVELRPDVAMFHYGLGSSYMNLGEKGKAAAAYKKAKALDPEITKPIEKDLAEEGIDLTLPEAEETQKAESETKHISVDTEKVKAFEARIQASFAVDPNSATSLRMIDRRYNNEDLPEEVVTAVLIKLGFEEKRAGMWYRVAKEGSSKNLNSLLGTDSKASPQLDKSRKIIPAIAAAA